MKTIKIEGKTYDVMTSISDLTMYDWIELTKVFSKREVIVIGKMATSDEMLTEEVEPGQESDEFKQNKLIEALAYLSGLDNKMFTDYPELIELIAGLIEWENLMSDTTPPADEIVVYGQKYSVLKPSKGTFQQWADLENFVYENKLFALIVYLTDGSEYNRWHPDYKQRIEMIQREQACGIVSVLESILAEANKIRESYKFVYGDTGEGSGGGKAMAEHCRNFKWEDVIVSIAETPMFNSPKGTLYAVRNAPVLEVLDYLNLKRSRDLAEYRDYKAQSKSNNS